MNSNPPYHEVDMRGYGLFRRLFLARENYNEAGLHESDKDSSMLLNNIRQARQEWLVAASNFEQADDPDLIDYYIYKMKACQVMYNYLIKKAKESGLRQDVYCN